MKDTAVALLVWIGMMATIFAVGSVIVLIAKSS
jgi:hypothetical protein